MRFSSSAGLALLGLVSLVSTAPTNLTAASCPVTRLPDGLPFPNEKQLEKIEKKARGTLPNMPLPDDISEEGIVSLKLIAFNELMEVAFFTQLLKNLTGNVPGYQIGNKRDREYAIMSLTAIQGQEELHAISANAALEHVGVEPILPCEYEFPVSTYVEAIVFITKVTDLVMGTLQDVVRRFARGGDIELAHLIASVIGQEGEQTGWYRMQQGRIPSELPFLTASALSFAFTAVQEVTVPGTCTNKDTIPLRTYEPLEILTPPGPRTQKIAVAFSSEAIEIANVGGLWMTYINQQNVPIVVPLHVKGVNDVVVAEALFPYDEHMLNGFTLAAVTWSPGPFPNASAVAKATLAAPGLIIVK